LPLLSDARAKARPFRLGVIDHDLVPYALAWRSLMLHIRVSAVRLRCAVLASVAIGFGVAGVGTASAADLSSSLVRTTDTGAWSPSSPDPSGIAYDAVARRLIITDGEVEEMPIYVGANYVTVHGVRVRAAAAAGSADR